MTQHAVRSREAEHHDASSNTIFGFWIYLMTDFILFATLFATYAVLRGGTAGGPSGKELFSFPFVLAETLVLLTSILTCGMAMAAIPRQDKLKTISWFGATFLLGACFLTMVGSELSSLVQAGNSWQKSAFLSSYFTLVGTHALHIVFGLLFIIFFMVQLWRRGFTDVVMRRLTCMGLFWFFSYLVWIFMFTIVYLMGGRS